MAVRKADVYFENTFKGVLDVPKGKVPIGVEEGTVAPYDLLFGALASCLYATFLDVAEKKKIGFESARIEVTGEKRTEVPTVLTWVDTKIIIKGAEKEAGLEKSYELATKYCSIYQTIAQVAKMSWSVEFED
jgi:putative redox protein